MIELFKSRVKVEILRFLALRGASSGRRLSRILHFSLSQAFKALRPLVKAKVLIYHPDSHLYRLNPNYLYHDELVSMIYKMNSRSNRPPSYLPFVPTERHVDPLSVYQLMALRETRKEKTYPKFSEVIREKYG